jgi:predicted dehydrogenase/threonine dehydrogenase-like Zn-dependent dehydrogenase
LKQVIQHFRSGELEVADVPTPVCRPNGVLVRTAASLISAGTERTVVDFAEKNLLQKARSRPDLVRQVLDKVSREGVVSTVEAVLNRLDQPLALGYSSAGTVVQVGREVSGFKPGDRVACAGGGFASHAEMAYIPRNLLVRLPDHVSFEAGAFATMGAIALQGIRQGEVKLGEFVAVIGLGILGQLTVQMLRAAGCRVMGVDTNGERVQQALALGADVAVGSEAAVAAGAQFTNSRDFDAIVITAHTESDDPITLAGELARDKGVVVAVGAVGMNVPRRSFYMKELDLRLSRSYGPGRYDKDYEEKGNDYPYAYVRWTEQRNMEAFLQLVAQGSVKVEPLISHRFPIAEAEAAYALIQGKTAQAFTGVVLTYATEKELPSRVEVSAHSVARAHAVKLGVLGSGNFANATLLPAIKGLTGVELVGIAGGSGVSARGAAKRFGFRYCAAQSEEILRDADVNTVAILTRHDLHARQTIAALEAGKNVFVEKPLVVAEEELEMVAAAMQLTAERAQAEGKSAPYLMVGFNRRFAPYLCELKARLEAVREPLMMNYRVNAGFIASDSWAHDPAQGGGRLIGEGCHFIDLLIHLSGSHVRSVRAIALPDSGKYTNDNFHLTLEFENGGVGNLTYVANGDKSFSKESLEVFGGGIAARLDDYSTLEIVQNGKRTRRQARLRADKGHRAEWEALTNYLLGRGPQPMAFEEVVASMRATFAAQRSMHSGEVVAL